MSLRKRRLLRLVLTGLVVLLLAGWGAFTTFFFNPLEGSYPFDVSTLVPRDVEFFSAKADLSRDLDPFPVPVCAKAFEESRAGQVIERQDWYRQLLADLDVQGHLASLDELLAKAPVKVSPLDLYGGKDLAIAGYFTGRSLAEARWAVYGRTGWIGKLGVELLDHPGWIGLEKQGLSVEPVTTTLAGDERKVGVTLSGGALTEPLTIARVRDVVVVASDPELTADAVRLGAVRGEDSFGLSAKYADQIDVPRRKGNELEVFVDAKKLSAAMGWTGEWPRRDGSTFLQAFLARLFQLSFVNELAGRVDFAGGVAVDLEGQLSSELLNQVQKRLYRQRGFDKNQVKNVARLVPADVGFFSYLHGDVSDLLRQALDSLDEATVTLLEDKVREVWGYQDVGQLIDEIDSALQGKAAFFLRNDDHQRSPKDPPNDGVTVPAWALVLWPQNDDNLKKVVQKIQHNPGSFGLQGEEQPDGSYQSGVYINTQPDTGSQIYEYWNVFVPGTGEITTIDIAGGGEHFFIVSNNLDLLHRVDKTFFNRLDDPAYPALATRPDFESYVNAGLPSASAMAWLNPRAMDTCWRKLSEELASLDVDTMIDWATVRPRLEQDVLAKNFSGRAKTSLSGSELEQLDLLTETAAESYKTDHRADALPTLQRTYADRIEMWEALKVALFELSLDPKGMAFHARLSIPLDQGVHAETTP